jgi:hypothetical protein
MHLFLLELFGKSEKERWVRQSKTWFLREWPPLFFARELFQPGNYGRRPTCFQFAEARAAPQFIAAAPASAKSSLEPPVGASGIQGQSESR